MYFLLNNQKKKKNSFIFEGNVPYFTAYNNNLSVGNYFRKKNIHFIQIVFF